MGLDAAHEIGVFARHPHRVGNVELLRAIEVRVKVSLHAADQIGGDEAQHPGLRGLRDEMPEAGHRHAAGPALIDQRADARVDAAQVGLEAEFAGDVLIDVRMGVDQPGGHDTPGDVDHLGPGFGRDLRLDGRDAIAADADVEDTVAPGRRIDHPTALQNKIKSHAVLLDIMPQMQAAHPVFAAQIVSALPNSGGISSMGLAFKARTEGAEGER